MDVRIRPAQQDDLHGLLLLLPQLSARPTSAAAQMPDPGRAAVILGQLLRRPGLTLLVAVDTHAGAVAGTLTLVQVPNLTYGGRPWSIIENVVVDRRYRREGIGWELMSHAMKLAQQEGCYKVQLISGRKPEQVQLYARLGFETSSCMGHKRYFS